MSGAIEILHEPSATEPFAVISKPAGLASAPLRSLDEESAFSQCARLFPAVLSVRGKKSVEGGLLHRIDTATSGLLLAAASQEFYDHIIAAQEAGRFVKGYRALCQIDSDNAKKLGGFPPAPRLPQSPKGWQGQNAAAIVGLELSSRFRPFGKGGAQVRPVVSGSNAAALKKAGSNKLYSTKIVAADFLQGGQDKGAADSGLSKPFVRVECQIAQGFRHQVRAHLAWFGLPIAGDALYNADFAAGQKNGEPMRFEAVSLEFPGLDSDKVFRFSLN